MSKWSLTDRLAISMAVLLATIALRLGHAGTPTLATAISAGFAILAWALRGVDGGGAIAGGAIAFVFFRAGGWRLFVLLLGVFVLTTAATKIGGARKAGGAWEKNGRSGAQVVANLLASAVVLLFEPHATGVLVSAALAELAADTVSSEMGESTSGKTYLLTNWNTVPSGTNGGISVSGTFFGILAAFVTAVIAFALDVKGALWIPEVAGIAGMFVDSLLGATFENRGWLNNEAVNLFGTTSAIGIAWALLVANAS